MPVDPRLIRRLRQMADQGASVPMMVGAIRESLAVEHLSIVDSARSFGEAFFLSLREVRDIEGHACLGGGAYTDEEIDRLMWPRIETTRHLWLHDAVSSADGLNPEEPRP